jgi:hypothetical protein
MKSFILLAASVLVILGNAFSQTATESQIKMLENEEIAAILKHDYSTLEKIWAEDFMVNNPSNMVIMGRSIVIDRMKEGVINYSGFERDIEEMMDLGNTVIVMGLETVYPKEGAPLAGQKVKRRYTNIWTLVDGKWSIKARHANVICRGD